MKRFVWLVFGLVTLLGVTVGRAATPTLNNFDTTRFTINPTGPASEVIRVPWRVNQVTNAQLNGRVLFNGTVASFYQTNQNWMVSNNGSDVGLYVQSKSTDANAHGTLGAWFTDDSGAEAPGGYLSFYKRGLWDGVSPGTRGAGVQLRVLEDNGDYIMLWGAPGSLLFLPKVAIGTADPLDVTSSFLGKGQGFAVRYLGSGLLGAPQNSAALMLQGSAWNAAGGFSDTVTAGWYIKPTETGAVPSYELILSGRGGSATPATAFSINGASGWTGAGTKVFRDDGTFGAVPGGADIWENSGGTVQLSDQDSNGTLKLSADDGAGAGTIEFYTAGSKRWSMNNGGTLFPEGNSDVGTTLKPIQALYSSAIGVFLSDRKVSLVTGTPESQTIAPVGSLALRGDGAPGTTLYSKVTGAGNTGWDPVPSSNAAIGTLGITIDGGGGEITTGIKGDIYVPYNCTIQSVTLLADAPGAIVVDIWKDVYANYPPTVADSITASAKPTLVANNDKSTDSTLTGWNAGKTVTAGDTLRFNVDSISVITRVTLTLKVLK